MKMAHGPRARKEEIEATVRRTVKEIGYEQDGFHWQSLSSSTICTASPRISRRASMPLRQQG
jgi:S-adenosylmethionine synthetase